ncbi:MAG TPA: hypothetical protein VMR25_07170 [Planctomycetaceae bacterium]|jgi:hypothetical protein|nr:hypothetical protein [Planctomycetaceae bacterium]
MNCDDVFEALTDPALSQTAQLEAHLAHCPRCRELQQVLEPARSLLCGELPVERVPGLDARDEIGAAPWRTSPSAESVGLAESIAAQLRASNRGKSVLSRRPLANRRVVVAALRSAALVLFGALAVYCIGSSDRESDSHALPAVVPVGPAKVCTRMDLQRKGRGSQDARRVILSCVGCHLNERPTRQQLGPTSLFWPPRRAAGHVSLASCDARVWVPITNGGRDLRSVSA